MASWSLSPDQTVWIAARATAFTAVCDACRREAASIGYVGATFGGTLPLEVEHATFECRRGHRIRVVRAVPLPVR